MFGVGHAYFSDSSLGSKSRSKALTDGSSVDGALLTKRNVGAAPCSRKPKSASRQTGDEVGKPRVKVRRDLGLYIRSRPITEKKRFKGRERRADCGVNRLLIHRPSG